ncbi:hypothetical protein EU527_08275 [Candidatus Thorarchaeota archaeon]|nr:MAG: hypothetical protein EU527_08275 [Candidatus Thorarchaeota archaeon]
MTKCSLCGADDLCFSCPYCNGHYCGEHRLPESHGCPGMQKVREDAKRKVSDSLGNDEYYKENQTWSSIMPKKKVTKRGYRKGRFTRTEIRDLAIASILVLLVGISAFGRPNGILAAIQNIINNFIPLNLLWVPLTTAFLFLLAFIGHELGHKFVAQHYGMWSEFRMTMMGYYLSLFAILFSLPIFGTGVVYTSGTSSVEEDGKTNLAGPMLNLIVAMFLIMIGVIVKGIFGEINSYILFIIQNGIIINGFIALFNMIPIQPFDGATVRRWDQRVWIATSISLIFVLIIGWIVLPSIA